MASEEIDALYRPASNNRSSIVNIPSDGINVVNKHKLIRSSGSIDETKGFI